LVWGEDDTFQLVEHAERFAAEIPNTTLIRVRGAGHIPMENDSVAVARALGSFFAGQSAPGGDCR
jgi:pimeloyl-ACP methyl ester carboxylesterase